jgi:hypothetical protein
MKILTQDGTVLIVSSNPRHKLSYTQSRPWPWLENFQPVGGTPNYLRYLYNSPDGTLWEYTYDCGPKDEFMLNCWDCLNGKSMATGGPLPSWLRAWAGDLTGGEFFNFRIRTIIPSKRKL